MLLPVLLIQQQLLLQQQLPLLLLQQLLLHLKEPEHEHEVNKKIPESDQFLSF